MALFFSFLFADMNRKMSRVRSLFFCFYLMEIFFPRKKRNIVKKKYSEYNALPVVELSSEGVLLSKKRRAKKAHKGGMFRAEFRFGAKNQEVQDICKQAVKRLQGFALGYAVSKNSTKREDCFDGQTQLLSLINFISTAPMPWNRQPLSET